MFSRKYICSYQRGKFYRVPAVSVGTRQEGRERGKNVISSRCEYNEIYIKIIKQMKKVKGKSEITFMVKGRHQKNCKILEKINVKIQKRLPY